MLRLTHLSDPQRSWTRVRCLDLTRFDMCLFYDAGTRIVLRSVSLASGEVSSQKRYMAARWGDPLVTQHQLELPFTTYRV